MLVGIVGGALVHDAGRTVGKRAVHYIGVPGDPSDIRGAPVNVGLGMDVEDHSMCRRRPNQIATGRVEDAFRLPGRAGGVEDIERVLRVHLLGWTVRALGGDQLVEPDVAAGGHRNVFAGALHHHHVAYRLAALERFVGALLQRHNLPTTPTAVGRDQHLGVAVVDAIA